MLTEIKTTLEILNAIPSLKNLFPDNSNKKQEKEKRMVVLRAYLAEVQHNYEILRVIKNGSNNEEAFDKLKAVAPLLENSVGALILYGSSNGELKDIKVLSKIQLTIDAEKNMTDTDDENIDTDIFIETKSLVKAICFCTLRIDILKSLATISDENLDFFENLNLTARLNNIKKYTYQIKKALEMNLNDYSEGAVI